MNILAHLTFNGNCRQAMTFYQKCLGGKLTFQTVGDSSSSAKLPSKMRHCIVQATLTKDKLILMGSDMVSEFGLIKGNAVTLVLHCKSEEELTGVYRKLSTGGWSSHPLETNFWGVLFGSVTDKFGNLWILSYNKKKKKRKPN